MKRLFTIITELTLGLLLISVLFQPQTIDAQRPDPPTATPMPTTAPVNKAPAVPAKVGVAHGYVIDYSNSGAPQGGVPVILSGQGWQAETVSDSNGYFQFLGLGDGEGALNLKLPPEAHPVNANWMVDTGIENPEPTNIGFYWGETPPLPVLLSTEANADSLTLKIANQSGGDANNIALAVSLPTGVTAKNASSKLGSIENNDNSVLFSLDTLPTGETVTLVLALQTDGTQTDNTASAALTYNEQLTSQNLILSVGNVSSQKDADVKATESETQPTAKTDDTEAFIPDTGHDRSLPQSTLPVLILSIVFIIGLGIAGVKAFKRA